MSRIVETSTGRVEGETQEGVTVFRGIPFAAPPTGRGRFRAPAPHEPWAGVRPATVFGPQAPQNAGPISTLMGGGEAHQDEDCLSLNVWTPATGPGRRPVMVWIHGGAFEIGAGSTPIYDGARVSRRGDLVLVTINYRLGVLGRLDLRGVGGAPLDTTANAATLDQIAALRWVRDNIAGFGGDPTQVTIFGESAGSMSVATLLATPAARGLFQRAIMQSGAANFVSPPAQAARLTGRLLDHLGLGAGQVERLWDLPAAALVKAQQKAFPRLGGGIDGLPFQPIVDDDVLPQAPLDAIATGHAADIPVLLGSNLEEMKLFGLFDPAFGTLDDAALLRRAERVLGERAGAAIAAYRDARSARGESVTPTELWYALDSDRTFRIPAIHLAERQRVHQAGVYVYLFTWQSPLLGGRLGAGHAVELPFVFGTLEEPLLATFAGQGRDALELALAMQDAWIAFAHGGRPDHPHLPAWPAYDTTRRATMILGRDRRVEDAPRDPERQFWERSA